MPHFPLLPLCHGKKANAHNLSNIKMILMYVMCYDVGRKAQVDDKDCTTM
jgi:hypothetical protein